MIAYLFFKRVLRAISGKVRFQGVIFRDSFSFEDDFLEAFQTVDLIERIQSQGAEDRNQSLGSNSVQGSIQASQTPFRRMHLRQHSAQDIRVANLCWIPDSCTRLQKPAIQPPAQRFCHRLDLADEGFSSFGAYILRLWRKLRS